MLFVQGNGCPISRNALPALRDLRRRYAERGVAFLMINANPQDERAAIAAEAESFDIDFPILVDETQLVAESLEVDRTAEVLILDPARGRVVFRGPLDDRLGYETQKPSASRHYAREALEALLAGDEPELTAIDSPGCIVALPSHLRSAQSAISYARDVVPILARRCLDCHRTGGIAPFSMSDFQTVRGWAPMMREAIRTKRMPPGQIDAHVGDWLDDRSLTPEEARLLVHWIEAGAPASSEPDPLPELASAPIPDWPLGEPDVVIELPRQQIPATGAIDYRYVTVPTDLDEDVWVRAVDVQPSNYQVLHHVLTWVIDPDGRRSGGSGSERWVETIFAGYAPGREAESFPEDTGRLLPRGARLRFQLHYTTSGREEVDAPRLGLYLAEKPPRHVLRLAAAINWRFEIPPHAANHEVTARHTFDRDVLLYRLTPHMHYRGRSMRFDAVYPDGARETLLSVPNYQFNWQRAYVLAKPRLLPAGTAIECHGAFDNSDGNPFNPDPTIYVDWGEQTTDEMFIGYLLYRDLEAGEPRGDEKLAATVPTPP